LLLGLLMLTCERYVHQALKTFGPHFTIRDVDGQNSFVDVVCSPDAIAAVMGFPAGSTPAEAAGRFAARPTSYMGST
jgi:hypothetical protein